uniref:Uncharacterized protein n=1 Tax=Odontella aurita TaxID=265563 RepID=A0A7S4NFY1_9STRA
MSEPGTTPRRRSFNRGRSGRRSGDISDDRSVGDRSANTTASSRRRRSRSPLRSVAKSSRSIVGRLSKIAGGGTKKKDRDAVFANAAAALGAGFDDLDDDDKAPSSTTSSNPAEPDVAGGKKISSSKPKAADAAAPEMDEESVYGVVIEKKPSSAGLDKLVSDAKKKTSTEATAAPSIKEDAVVPEPVPAPALETVQAKEEPATKKESKKSSEKAEKDAAKKAEEEAASAAAGPSPSATAASVAPPASISPGSAIQIILLLMDPSSRRFELLQLEFDSTRALVSDVLCQIPHSATVESMRTQKYRAVCDRKGREMDNGSKLDGFTKGKEGEVILAIPQDMSSRECAKLAKPILSDPNVVAMLNPPSASLAPVKEDTEKKAKEAPESKSRAAPALAEEEPSKDASGGSGFVTFLTVLVGLASVAAGTYFLHEAITASLGSGDSLKPGSRRSKCGFLGLVPPVILEKLSDLAEQHAPGHAGLIPEVCEPAGIEMGEDGILRKYHGGGTGGETVWEIAGGLCPEGDEECVPGLVVEENGALVIGGKPGKIKKTASADEMVPWPFDIDPAKAGSKWW